MRANVGPLSLWHILKRRNISFERWCDDQGISNRDQFRVLKHMIEAEGQFFLDPEMTALGEALPAKMPPLPEEATPVLLEPAVEELAVVEVPAVVELPVTETLGSTTTGKKTKKSV